MQVFSKYKFWLLSLMLILFLTLPSWFFPLYYLDENIYLALGDRMANGDILYVDVWDHKPPMLYLVYAISSWLFGPSILPLKVLNSVLIFISCLSLYNISKHITNLSDKVNKIIVIIFIITWGLLFEGITFNGENLFVPLILLGFWQALELIKSHQKKQNILNHHLIIFTLSWGFALLTKVHAVVEICLLFIFFVLYYLKSQNISLDWKFQFFKKINKQNWLTFTTAITLSILPWLITIVFYYLTGYQDDLWFAVWGYNQLYIETAKTLGIFGLELSWLVGQALLWLFCTTIAMSLYLSNKIKLETVFLWLWFITNCFLVLIPARPYPHYILQAVAVIILLGGVILSNLKNSIKWQSITTLVVFVTLFTTYAVFYSGPISYLKYKQYFSFYTIPVSSQSLEDWQTSPRTYSLQIQSALKSTITENTSKGDTTYIYWESPEVYALSQTKPANRFLVFFHLQGELIDELYQDLEANNPKLVIIKNDLSLSRELNQFFSTSGNYTQIDPTENNSVLDQQVSIWQRS